jgi:hypothetical protein
MQLKKPKKPAKTPGSQFLTILLTSVKWHRCRNKPLHPKLYFHHLYQRVILGLNNNILYGRIIFQYIHLKLPVCGIGILV